jgi:DNA-binding MurR/RpiR family transcriptional regulator
MTVAQIIHDTLDTMTAGERRAARALLARYPLLGLRTVADFAAEAGVSSPTVLRFVARLGYDNYAGLQDALHDELTEQFKSPLAKASTAGSGPLDAISTAVVANIQATMGSILASELTAVVELLVDPRHPVFITGGRFTDALARYMATHLRLVRPGVHHLDRTADARRDQLLDMPKGTRLVCFDIRRYDGDLAEFVAAAVARGVVIVLMTDQWMSPVALQADHVLTSHIEVPSIWDSNAALMTVVEVILAGVTRGSWDSTTERLHTLEELRADPPGGQRRRPPSDLAP